MTAERQQQIQQVFHDARGRAPNARASFLDEACREDAELRQEVTSLLQSDAQAVLAAQLITTEQAVLEVGQVLGHYRIERQLGAGGMGVVYLARDTKLGRPVTLKLLQARYTQDRERLRRFQQEARAASALNHPNLLTIYEVGQTASEVGGAHYIVAEYVEGQTLRELFHLNTMQLGTALDIAIQITDAIAAAHQAGIIHRDIKPENIMVRPDGIVKVLDFGLAKLTEARNADFGQRSASNWIEEVADTFPPSPLPTPHSTAPGLVMGTVAYMSPEQARGLAVDARSDVFSVGVVLYELLTGRKPFQGETQSDVLAALLEREPPPLTHYISALPVALEKIIIRALAKAPAERYQTASLLGADLKQLQQELEFAGHLSRSADKPSPLAMKVGAGALGEEITRFLNVPTRRQSAAARDPLQTNFRRIALFAAAVLLVLAGVLVGRARWQSPDRSFNSIAVLPFSAVGNEAQMEFLPEALTENLIDSLTRLPSLRVSARNTVISYKGREVDPRQAGKELQVAAVITGRVQWQAERMVIRVELVDTADGTRLWGEEFRPARANLLTVQEEIAREIAAKLQRRLSPADQQQLAKRHTTDSKAYELYAQGRYLYLQYTRESQEKALESFRQAIALDPHYALAYCGIADVYADFSSQYLSPKEAMPKAREAALKAIEYDESLPEAHHSLALVKLWGDWDWAGAERECKRALELNPNLAHTRIYYSEFLAQQGRFEEALRELKRAQEYDPVSLQAQAREGSIYFLMRQYERAIPIFRQLHTQHPHNTGLQRQLALALAQKGLLAEALALVTPLQTPTSSPYQISLLAYLYARSGQRNEALKLLRELSARTAHERVSPLHFARIYIGLNDKEQAFIWLRKGYEEQSDHLLHIGTDPLCDPLRADPRFSELLRGMGLTS